MFIQILSLKMMFSTVFFKNILKLSTIYCLVAFSFTVHSQIYIPEGVTVSNIDLITITESTSDVDINQISTLNILEGTKFSDTKKEIFGNVVFYKSSYSKENKYRLTNVNSIIYNTQEKNDNDNLQEKINKSFFITYPLPGQTWYGFSHHKQATTPTTPTQSQHTKDFKQQQYFKVALTAYRYSNKTLLNKQIAQHPVEAYASFLRSNHLDLPPPIC